jgi:hypothetical protein
MIDMEQQLIRNFAPEYKLIRNYAKFKFNKYFNYVYFEKGDSYEFNS